MPAAVIARGVSKSGSPISRCTICRPCAASARACASTSYAVSVPSRPMRRARGRIAASLVRKLPFDAHAAGRSDDRGVRGARRQHHAIAWLEVDDLPVTQAEVDRAARAVQELVVQVRVLAVAIAGSVRPRVHVARLGADRKSTRLNSSHRTISYAV